MTKLTPQELNERIYAAIHDGVTLATDNGQPYLAYTDEAEDLIKQLIRDCIAAVTPKKVDSSKYKYEDSEQDFALGYIQCSIEVESNTKELLG